MNDYITNGFPELGEGNESDWVDVLLADGREVTAFYFEYIAGKPGWYVEGGEYLRLVDVRGWKPADQLRFTL